LWDLSNSPAFLSSVPAHRHERAVLSETIQMKRYLIICALLISGIAQARTVAKDFNRDGYSDLVWENTATGQRAIWLLKKRYAFEKLLFTERIGGLAYHWSL
jgi:hypothetical protein